MAASSSWPPQFSFVLQSPSDSDPSLAILRIVLIAYAFLSRAAFGLGIYSRLRLVLKVPRPKGAGFGRFEIIRLSSEP